MLSDVWFRRLNSSGLFRPTGFVRFSASDLFRPKLVSSDLFRPPSVSPPTTLNSSEFGFVRCRVRPRQTEPSPISRQYPVPSADSIQSHQQTAPNPISRQHPVPSADSTQSHQQTALTQKQTAPTRKQTAPNSDEPVGRNQPDETSRMKQAVAQKAESDETSVRTKPVG